jgi:ssDNA-binding Zn-finger/Zn-ribbon topoisomerase 1
MRRYAYSGGIGIVTDTDDDGNAASTPEKPAVTEGAVPCPQCGKPLRERTGAKGPFVGCSGYPACKFTANGTLAQFTGEGDVDPDFGSLPAAPPTTPASDPLVQRIVALAKAASKDHVRESFGAVEGGAACLAPMGDGTWRIRGAALAALSAETKQAIIDKLDDIPF